MTVGLHSVRMMTRVVVEVRVVVSGTSWAATSEAAVAKMVKMVKRILAIVESCLCSGEAEGLVI